MRKIKGFDQDAYIKRLRLLREAYGDTQTEFAARLGVPFKRYSNWERGYPIGREAAFLMKDKLHIDPTWLWWGWTNNMPKHLMDKIEAAEKYARDQALHDKKRARWEAERDRLAADRKREITRLNRQNPDRIGS